MYILDIKKIKNQGIIYIIATLLCAIFSAIYESFSHGVISNFMVWAFLIPLLLGVVVTYIFYFFGRNKLPTIFANRLYNAGVATLTVGSIMEGVLEIYGTTNVKVYAYLVVGGVLLVASVVVFLSSRKLHLEECN